MKSRYHRNHTKEEQNKRIEQSKKCDECYDYYEDIGYEHCDKECFMEAMDYEGEIFCKNEDYGYMYFLMENYFVTTIEIEDA